MKTEPKVYILCGKIASGKTTYAKEVLCKQGILLSVDDVMLNLYDGCLKEQHGKTVERILHYFYTLIPQLLEQGCDCIIDYGFWTKKERMQIQQEMKEHNFPYEMLYLKKSEEVRRLHLKQRNEENKKKSGRQYIIEGELLKQLDLKFEEIGEEENITIIPSDTLVVR